MLDSGLWHFLAKAGITSAFPLGLQEDEMRMMPRWSVGCGVSRTMPQKEAGPGISPSPARTGTSAAAEGDGEELLKCPAGAGRAARSVRASGEQAAGHFSDTMGQMSVSSQWPARSSVPLSSSA